MFCPNLDSRVVWKGYWRYLRWYRPPCSRGGAPRVVAGLGETAVAPLLPALQQLFLVELVLLVAAVRRVAVTGN